MFTSMFAIYVFVVIINFLYGFYCSVNNKDIVISLGGKKICTLGNILVFILIITFISIIANTTKVSDFNNYKSMYENGVEANSIEIGYISLENFFKMLNLSFEQFRVIIFLIGYILLFLGTKKLNVNTNIAFSLYAVTPFTLDAIQIRNFLAYSVIVFAIQYLLTNEKKGNIKFIILVLIASSIHSVSLVYLLLLIANNKRNKKIRQKLLCFLFFSSIIFSVLLKLNSSIENLFSHYIFNINQEKGEAYITGNMNLGFLYIWMMEIGYIISAYLLGINSKNNTIEEQLFWINIAIACTFPLCIINTNFSRIYRNLFIINYGQLYLILRNKRNEFKYKNFAIIIFFITFAFNIYWTIGNAFEYAFLPFFDKV